MEKEYTFFQNLRKILKPEVEEIAAYIIFVVLVVSIAGYKALSSGTPDSDTTGVLSLSRSISELITTYTSGSETWARIFLFGFWFIIGVIVYSLLWAITTLIVDIKNDVRITMTFVHPSSFARSHYLASTIGRTILRWSIAGVGLLYAFFWVIVIVPASITVTENVFSNPWSFSSVTTLLFIAAAVMITLHIATIILKTLLNRTSYRA